MTPLPTGDFDLISRVVFDAVGIALTPDKDYLVEARLTRLAHTEGFGDIGGLLEAFRGEPQGPLTDKIVDAMTTNETLFFRDTTPFEALRRHVIPALRRSRAPDRTLRIWSAACSTGQEPYSVAMAIHDHFPELAGWDIDIVASDVSDRVLERARRATYAAAEVNRGLTPELLARHFEPTADGFRVRDAIAAPVTFARINLSCPPYPVAGADVVLLRNVLLYFDRATRARITEAVVASMTPDAFLFLGAGESLVDDGERFRQVDLDGFRCYQRRTAGQALGATP